MNFIIYILTGALAGWLAGFFVSKNKGGFWWNLLWGIVGGFVGGLIGNLLKVGGGWLSGLILAIVGSCLVIFVVGKMKK